MYGITCWQQLKKGPIKAKSDQIDLEAWKDGKFTTPSGKYEFYSQRAKDDGHTALPKAVPKRKPSAPFRILTPHSKFSIHSQFQNIDYMAAFNPEPYVCIHPDTAAEKQIKQNDLVRIFNAQGELKIKARV